MSQSVVIWDNKTHSRDRHPSPQHAHAVIHAHLYEGMGCEGKVFPVAAMVTTNSTKYVIQDCLGYWWFFTKKPVQDAQDRWCFLTEDSMMSHASGLGWWTYKIFNLE